MNKLVKGSIAGAAGIALLLGGAGTLALWNTTTAVNAGSVNSGSLAIAAGTDPGTWDQTIDFIVPGDTLTYSETFTITGEGTNLSVVLSSNAETLVHTAGIDAAVITSDFVVKDSLSAIVAVDGNGHYDLGTGVYTVDVEITVDFPDTVIDQVDQNETLDLSAITVTATQVAPLA